MDTVSAHDKSGFLMMARVGLGLGPCLSDVDLECAYTSLLPLLAIKVKQLCPARKDGIFSFLASLD